MRIQPVRRPQGKKVWLALPYTFRSNHSFPGLVVCAHSGISNLYRSSSLPTSAVLRSGLSELELSIRVRTLQAPMVRGITFHLLFPCLTAKWNSRWSRLTSQEFWSRQLFRAPFLAPSPCYGGEQCDPKKVCSVAQFGCRIPHTASLLRKATI